MKKLLLCSLIGFFAYNFGKGVALARAYDYFNERYLNEGWY